MNSLQCSPLNSNSRKPTKFVLTMRCSNYEFALSIKCKYNELSRDHNHLSKLTEPEDCTVIKSNCKLIQVRVN